MGLFSNGHSEPKVTPLPKPTLRSPAVQAALDDYEQHRQDCAFLRDENARLSNAVKLANEHIKLLKSELATVRDQLDYVSRHSVSMLNSLDNIETLIVAAKTKARAEAYAPPGSGVAEDRAAETQEKIDEAVAQLAGKLAPLQDHQQERADA